MQQIKKNGETWYVNEQYAVNDNSNATGYDQSYISQQQTYNQDYVNQQQVYNQDYVNQQQAYNQQQVQVYDQSYMQYSRYNQPVGTRTMSHHIVDRVYQRIQGFKATNGDITKQWLLYLAITFGISIIFMLCFPDMKYVLAGEGFKVENGSATDLVLGNLIYLMMMYCVKPVISIGFFDVIRWYFYGKPMKFIDSVRCNIKNKVKVLSTKVVTVGLWTLLFIAPGIIKGFEYYFVECLLLDNPNMSWHRAFELSKILTNGRKMDIFLSMLNLKIIWRSLLFGIGTMIVPAGWNVLVDTSIIPSYSLLKMEWYEQALQEKCACGAVNIQEIRG